MTSATYRSNESMIRSEYWINPKMEDNAYRGAVERIVDLETGEVIKDRDISRKFDYSELTPKFIGVVASEWFYPRPAGHEEEFDEYGNLIHEEYFCIDEDGLAGLKRVSICQAKKFMDYKGKWPDDDGKV